MSRELLVEMVSQEVEEAWVVAAAAAAMEVVVEGVLDAEGVAVGEEEVVSLLLEILEEAIEHATTAANQVTLLATAPMKCQTMEEQGVAEAEATATVTTAVSPDILHETVAPRKLPLRGSRVMTRCC
jgi:hypothetical protein